MWDVAEAFHSGRGQPLGHGRVGHGARDSRGAAAHRFDLPHRLVERRGVEVVGDDVRPFLCEAQRYAPADSAPRSRDNGYTALNPIHVRSFARPFCSVFFAFRAPGVASPAPS